MTAIAGVVKDGTVYMGADGIAVDDSGVQHSRADSKLCILHGGFLIGGAGSPRMFQLVEYVLDLPLIKEGVDFQWMVRCFIPPLRKLMKSHLAEDEDGDLNGGLLVGVEGRLYEVQADYQVAEHEQDYWAIGNGREVCLGSLASTANYTEPERRIQVAIGAAAEHLVTVGGKLTILSVAKGSAW